MSTETAAELAPLLTQAHILMFEYQPDGSLMSVAGSCLGGGDGELEIRAGLVSPDVVRRARGGELVVAYERIAGRTIKVRHEPVRGRGGRVERIVATAVDFG